MSVRDPMLVKRFVLLAALAACDGQSCGGATDVPDASATNDACTTVCAPDAGPSCPDLTRSCCGVTCNDASAWGCLFGACSEQLQPTTAAARSIAADESGVYWATGTDVMRLSFDASVPSSLATGQDGPSDLVIGGRTLYWTTAAGDLVAAPVDDGGAPVVIASGSVGVATQARHQVAADDSYVYWISTPDDAGLSSLMTNASDGGAPSPFATSEHPSALAVDQTSLFICSGGVVKKLDKILGQPQQLGQGCAGEIAISATAVYWTAGTQKIITTSKDGSGGSIIAIPNVAAGETLDGVSNLLVANTTLFWINHVAYPGALEWCGTILSSSKVDAGVVNLSLCPADLAASSTSFFWSSVPGFLVGGGDIQSVSAP